MRKITFSKNTFDPEEAAQAIRRAEEDNELYLLALAEASGEPPEDVLAHAAGTLRFNEGRTMGEALQWLWRHGYPQGPYRTKPPTKKGTPVE